MVKTKSTAVSIDCRLKKIKSDKKYIIIVLYSYSYIKIKNHKSNIELGVESSEYKIFLR